MTVLPSTGRPQLGRALLALAVTLATVTLFATAGAAATRHRHAPRVPTVPQGFVGIDLDGPLLASGTTLDLSSQMASMVAHGVESVRAAFNWAQAQPYASWSHVPADQRARFTESEPRPTDFSATDAIVGAAAAHGLTVLPTILYAPGWDARKNPHGYSIPRQAAPYAQYAAELVGRYGPRGTFWSENPSIPRRPIREWQIWNEPNLSIYWTQPFAKSYVALLRAAHNSIKHADRGAKVVLGALTNLAWRAVSEIYRVRGARRLFDVVSVNGFTKTPSDVILFLRLVRRSLQGVHDGRRPLLATELSWPSAVGQTAAHNDFATTPAQQARNIAALLPMLRAWRARLRLTAFYYYDWIGTEYRGAPTFSFAGLLAMRNGQVVVKPALRAYADAALAIEGCRAKGATPTACLH